MSAQYGNQIVEDTGASVFVTLTMLTTLAAHRHDQRRATARGE